MIRKSHFTNIMALCVMFATSLAAADNNSDKNHRPFDERTLKGSYVFAGRVLLNPIAAPGIPVNPPRVLIDCFSIGELRFDGRGTIKRRVEIRCPTTPNVLLTGLGMPPPVEKPTTQEISIMGTTLTTQGTYQLGVDGWGNFSDAGYARLGPLPGNPTSGAGRISVRKIRGGIAQELVLLLDHQSLQPPGAGSQVNSDIGASFVARRR